jgi:hypothetical protein
MQPLARSLVVIIIYVSWSRETSNNTKAINITQTTTVEVRVEV